MIIPWQERRIENNQYLLLVVFSFVLAYSILMIIPFAYDQWNRSLFEEAQIKKELVIQEFSGQMEDAIVAECQRDNGGSVCDSSRLYTVFSVKKLISLDYVEQMQSKALTTTSAFVVTALYQLGVLIAGIVLVGKYAKGHTSRFVLFVFVFLLVIVSNHLLSSLPHKNTKFYYVFGAMFGVLLSVSDFLHRVNVTRKFENYSEQVKSMLIAAKHKSWSSVLQYSLGLLTVVLGTISFTLLGYIRTIFGESFVFYPLLGIVVSLAFLTFVYYFGIIRNILLILSELEDALTDEATAVSDD